jgi:virginiamycin B lyase
VALYDPAAGTWREWRLPGEHPQAYAVYVDDRDVVWLSDFGANALVRFDPQREAFEAFALPSAAASVLALRPSSPVGTKDGSRKTKGGHSGVRPSSFVLHRHQLG